MKKLLTICTLMMLASVSVLAQNATEKKSDKPAKVSKTTKSTKNDNPVVLIKTSMGDMKVMLYNGTPQHRDNFLKLVKSNFYDSLLFHRVIQNFMIQGGDPLSKNSPSGTPLGMGDNGYTVPAEFNDSLYFHKKGAICAARTENPAKASSGCQFYIVQGQKMSTEQVGQLQMQRGMQFSEAKKQAYTTLGGTPQLDGGYTVFGEVIEGLDIIDKIAAVKTSMASDRDRPLDNVYILSMKQIK